MEEPNATDTGSTVTEQGLWQLFDQQVAEMAWKPTSSSDAVVEMQKYLKHKYVYRLKEVHDVVEIELWPTSQLLHVQHLALKYCVSLGLRCQLKGYLARLENLYQQDEVG